MTEIILQVQGAEPRCFILEVRYIEDLAPLRMRVSVWALSAFDALEQGKRALPREESFAQSMRFGAIERVALCPAVAGVSEPWADARAVYYGPGQASQKLCTATSCARHQRIGVLA